MPITVLQAHTLYVNEDCQSWWIDCRSQTAAEIHTLPRHPSSEVKPLSWWKVKHYRRLLDFKLRSVFWWKSPTATGVAVHTYVPDFLKEYEQNFWSSRQQKPLFPFLTSSLLIDSELDVPRWHCTIMFEISSPETSTTLLQKVVGCNRSKYSKSHRAKLQCKHSHGNFTGEREPVQGF